MPSTISACHPLLLLPSIFPSTRVFSSESVLHIRWPKYWSFSFSISPSNEYSGLIFFKMDWFYLLVVLGTLKSLLQHYSSKALILQCSALFMVQLSHPYMTTGKTIALNRWTFVFMANPKQMASEHWVHSSWPLLSKWLHMHGLGHDTCYLLNATKVSPLLNISLSLYTMERNRVQILHLEIFEKHVPCVCHLFRKTLLKSPLMSFLEKIWRNRNATNHFLPSHWTSY